MRRHEHKNIRFAVLCLALTMGWAAVPAASAAQSPDEILAAVVGLTATVPDDARTAGALGTERAGSGVVIDDQGLVLTIGYLILEATSVSVTTHRGEDLDARIIAYDYATGFGLVKTTEPPGLPAMALGESSELGEGDPVLVISSGGADGVRPGRVVSRRDFAGYWEYLLEGAIFVSPPHRFFAGSALLSPDSRLVGIGSLIVSDAASHGSSSPGNMFVPIDALKPILDSLVESGRDPAPRRPWIGVYTEEHRGHVFVTRVAEDGPAQGGGIVADDIILRVGDTAVDDMAGFLRAMWALGDAGVTVPLTILRGGELLNVEIESADRYRWLRLRPAGVTAMSRAIDTI